MTFAGPTLLVACALLASPALTAAADFVEVTADPATVRLHGPSARYSLLITGQTADGRLVDRTSAARFQSLDARVVRVTGAGVIHAVTDGATTVRVLVEGRTLSIPVTVIDSAKPRRLNFENDIEPILSRFGCNSSGCHGKAEGQNGFKLSVFGFDAPADFAALTKESRGRRVFPAAPEQSLLLRKMTGQMPHGGGARIAANSSDYDTIRAWIAAGMPVGSPSDPSVASIRVEPRERILAPRGRQQLRVVARYSDGREVDVTAHAKFQSNNDALATVQPSGLVMAGDAPGDAAIMAGYMNAVDTFRLAVPRAERIEHYPAVPENNFIDRLVFRKLRKLNILPSDLADDAEYLRRVYLDVIGTLPTAAEAHRFLDDKRPDRRARLVEELLHRPEFADFWALQWADLLRVDRAALGPKRAYAYYKWIHDNLAANRPFDAFARALVTAEGPLREVAPANFYKVVVKPGQTASTLAQVFLGIRIACAECHHHPFDRWSQDDYYGMTAFFSGVGVRKNGGTEALSGQGMAQARNPRTGEDILAHPLDEKMPAKLTPGDRRTQLADWLTSPRNPWFARNLANRVWAHFLGRGIIDPVDDVRATNPPSNPELLDALGQYVVENKYDLHALIRLITASRVYQLSSKPNATNERDEQNHSRARFKRISAEVLLDMVSQTTGVAERFAGAPSGTRAIQLWDSKVPHYFLKVFGRPQRISACECERNHEPSVAQVLHLLNAPEIHVKLSHEGGFVTKLAKRQPADGPLVEELYLTFFSRRPEEKERQATLSYLQEHKANRRAAVEDLAWSMVNSLEFIFNH
ncbi:MAG TPA: DUF1549 and DUF1553 domain-containing protein [Gemmataceae bacterium]|nr:DUF1549 and DUF1553 domain-containing protein [Gemmataceae bacterium]